jgi:hypothetical protein
VRLKEIQLPHQKVLRDLTRRISRRLKTDFAELPGADTANIGVELREEGRAVVIQLPEVLLQRAPSDAASRESMRVHIKTRRDRMLFRQEPVVIEQRPAAKSRSAPDRGGFGGFGGPGRGRR